MVQIGSQDERPSQGSEASEATGASTEAAADTVQMPKIRGDQDGADSATSAHVSDASQARGRGPSGMPPPEGPAAPVIPATPATPARVPPSAPTVIAKSPSGSAEPATPATPGRPSAATPPSDSVFTPWSARRRDTGAGNASTTKAPEPTLLAGVDLPSGQEPASEQPGGPAAPAAEKDQPVRADAARKSATGSVTPPAGPRLTKPTAGLGGATAARPGSARDPLSGPWPSFTRRTEPAAEPAGPEPAAAQPEPASMAAAEVTPDPDRDVDGGTGAPEAQAGNPAAAVSVAAELAAAELAAAELAAAESAGPADVTAAAARAPAGIGSVWTAGPASPLGASDPQDAADEPVLPLAGASAAGTLAAFGTGAGPAHPAGSAYPAGPVYPAGPSLPPGPAGPAGPERRRRLGPLIGVAAAVTALVVGGGTYFLLQKPSTARAAGDHPAKTQSPVAKGPEHVVAITPADGTHGVNGAADIRVEFSSPLGATSPMPALSPAIAGSWRRDGDSAVFVPAQGFKPRTNVTVRVPAGGTGVTSAGGGQLASPVTATFRVGTYRAARLEQLLAQLGYLPLTWAPLTGSPPALSDTRAQLSAAYQPPAGTYTWQSGYPAALTRLWKPDKPSQVLQGAVMAFQADHGLMSDMVYENQVGLTLKGSVGRRLWKAMFRAIARDATNKHGYTYALASQHSPETLTVWHNGVQIFRHLANTGIPVAPTAVRTDPVYIRLQSQIMKGTNPDGTKYADPVAWVAYFHAGEAVHYFPRYSYGSQQSLGCVELPWTPAKKIWPYLTYGTLVTVTAP